MTLSKNRLKNILKKNKIQTKKKLKKRINKKNQKKKSFRNKKINIRKKSIKHYRKRFAKKKRKVYIKGGGSNDIYNQEIYTILNEFMKKSNASGALSINDEDKSELEYYNFDFILIDEKNNQEILDATKVEKEFDERAKTAEEIAEEIAEEKKRDIKDRKDIDEGTKKYIEDGKEICKSHVYVVNGENPVAFTDTCDNGQEIESWFQEIFNNI